MANTKKYVSLDKLSLYDEKIKAKIKADDEAALAAAKLYADGLAVNYDASGAAATAEANAKSYTDGKITEVNTAVAGVKTTAEKGVADAATAQGAAEAAQSKADEVGAYVGTFTHDTAKTVVEYINAKTDGIATSGNLEALAGRVTTVEGDVATIKANYLDGDDKTELEGKINAKADQTALDEVAGVANAAVAKADYDVKVAALEAEDARIAGLVSAEAERAAGVESGLKGRIETMEAFWAAAQADETDKNVIDTLKEIQDYISSDETGAANMLAAIEANEKAIEDMDTAYKAADETLQGNIDTLTGVVNGKVAQGDFDTLSGKVTAAEGKISANETAISGLQEADAAIRGRLDALEGAIGESGSVADDIATAKQEAIDAAAGYTDAAIEGAKTDASNKDAVVLAEAQKATVAVQTALDTHTANGDIHVTAEQKTAWTTAAGKAHEHDNKTVLDGITAEKVTAWDGAEKNAKDYADGLNTTMNGRVETLETWHNNFTECSEQEINDLFA